MRRTSAWERTRASAWIPPPSRSPSSATPARYAARCARITSRIHVAWARARSAALAAAIQAPSGPARQGRAGAARERYAAAARVSQRQPAGGVGVRAREQHVVAALLAGVAQTACERHARVVGAAGVRAHAERHARLQRAHGELPVLAAAAGEGDVERPEALGQAARQRGVAIAVVHERGLPARRQLAPEVVGPPGAHEQAEALAGVGDHRVDAHHDRVLPGRGMRGGVGGDEIALGDDVVVPDHEQVVAGERDAAVAGDCEPLARLLLDPQRPRGLERAAWPPRSRRWCRRARARPPSARPGAPDRRARAGWSGAAPCGRARRARRRPSAARPRASRAARPGAPRQARLPARRGPSARPARARRRARSRASARPAAARGRGRGRCGSDRARAAGSSGGRTTTTAAARPGRGGGRASPPRARTGRSCSPRAWRRAARARAGAGATRPGTASSAPAGRSPSAGRACPRPGPSGGRALGRAPPRSRRSARTARGGRRRCRRRSPPRPSRRRPRRRAPRDDGGARSRPGLEQPLRVGLQPPAPTYPTTAATSESPTLRRGRRASPARRDSRRRGRRRPASARRGSRRCAPLRARAGAPPPRARRTARRPRPSAGSDGSLSTTISSCGRVPQGGRGSSGNRRAVPADPSVHTTTAANRSASSARGASTGRSRSARSSSAAVRRTSSGSSSSMRAAVPISRTSSPIAVAPHSSETCTRSTPAVPIRTVPRRAPDPPRAPARHQPRR